MSRVRAEETPTDAGDLIHRREIPPELPLWLRISCGILTFVNDLARKKDGTFNRGIMNFVEYKSPANSIPDHGVSTKDVVIDPKTGVWVRIFLPEVEGSNPQAGKPLPVVFYFHGGGFSSLSPDFILYDVFCRRLARRRKVVVVSVDYRRAPEHRYPTAYEDSYAAVKWVGTTEGRSHVGPIADVSRCYLMGDSAGGNIVHQVGCRVAADVDVGPMKVVGHVLIQPFFGGEERTASELRLRAAPIVGMETSDWHWRVFLPEGVNRDHPAANVFGPHGADISGVALPPSLVVVGGHDPLQDWQLRYVEDMKQKMNKNVELLFYGEGIHAFHIFFQLQVSSKLITDLEAFFRRCGE